VLFDSREVAPPGVHLLPPGRTVLGRTTLTGWGHGEDPLLSRAHLALELHGDRLVARDLDSRNGSQHNGRALTEAALDDGDVLRLGDSFLLVRQVPNGLRPVAARGALAPLAGDSPVMHQLRGELRRLGPRDTMVLLRGESGTGKTVAAQVLHALSGRRGPLVSVNCAAIPEHLAEATLFGHERGAFTGAERPRPGVFREASGGTLFLDEVADLPLPLQPKLLHAVEAGEVLPVGSSRPVAVDNRILSATSLDLDDAVASGRFRGELRARLEAYVLCLPPLRQRREDILPLFTTIARAPLHPELVARLLAHDWPYNVRELLKLAEEVAARGADLDELGTELVDARLGAARVAPPSAAPPAAPPAGPPTQQAIQQALTATDGSVAETARRLGRSRRQLYRDLERHGIDPADFRDDPARGRGNR